MEATKFVLAAVLGLTLLSGSIFAAGKKIVVEVSTTVLPIAQAAAEKFMDMNPEANITVRGGGSGVGVASMKDTEVQKAIGRGVEPKAYVVAMDGIAVIVNPSNPVNALTKKIVKDIYTGKISNWSKAGGLDLKIVVVSRD